MNPPVQSAVSPRATAGSVVRNVAWLSIAGATLASVVHVIVVNITSSLFDTLTFTSREFAWLVWAGNAVIFLLLVPFVAGVTLLWRRGLDLRVPVLLIGIPACLALTLLLPGVHPAAQLVLAIGLAIRASVVVGRNPQPWMRRIRRATVIGIVIVASVALAAHLSGRYAERRTLAGLPPARDGAPNVILLILDTVRAANLSAYGYGRPTTPNLDRLASEGVLFEHAFSTAPWTAPSHASMVTGLYAAQTRADYLHPMTPTATTVAELMTDAGYVTGGFVANAAYAGHQMGLARGFSHYEDFPISLRQALLSSVLVQARSGGQVLKAVFDGEWWRLREAVMRPSLRTDRARVAESPNAAEIARNFLSWRARVDPARPYFAMINVTDAHSPFEPPDGFRTRFGDGSKEFDRYDGSIAYVDHVIGGLIAELRARGDYDRTVFIVTSDHGELWGEHGLDAHGNSLFLPVLHVPLIVRTPGAAPAISRPATVVSLRDIAATILDLAGVSPGPVPGVSLAPIWRTGRTEGHSPVIVDATPGINPRAINLTRYGHIYGSIDSTWHYIRYGNGKEELFDWRSDPDEAQNLVTTPAGAAEAGRLRGIIERELNISLTGTPPPAPGG